MDTIEQLKRLNLSEYPIAELDNLLTKLGGLAIMLIDYHEKAEYPKLIERAVNNTKKIPSLIQFQGFRLKTRSLTKVICELVLQKILCFTVLLFLKI